MPKKVLSYEEKNYDKTKEIYDCLVQAFEDLKVDKSTHGWNLMVEKLTGTTMKLAGPDNLVLYFHRYETGYIDEIAKATKNGGEFLDELEKELKRRFRKMTGRSLKLKQTDKDQTVEKVSQVQNKHTSRPFGRYLVRDSRVYEFDFETLE